MTKRTEFVIPKTGLASGKQQVRAIYSKTSSEMLEAVGETGTQRASHVEPGSELSQKALVLIYPTYSQRISGEVSDRLQIQPVWATHWFADMTPTGREQVLGPFGPGQRDEALAAEVEWLRARNLPVCEPCIEAAHCPVTVTPWYLRPFAWLKGYFTD